MKDLKFLTGHTYTTETREYGFTALAEFADNYGTEFRPDKITVEDRTHLWKHPEAPPVTSTERLITISGQRILTGGRLGKKRVTYTWHSDHDSRSQLTMPNEVVEANAQIVRENAGQPA